MDGVKQITGVSHIILIDRTPKVFTARYRVDGVHDQYIFITLTVGQTYFTVTLEIQDSLSLERYLLFLFLNKNEIYTVYLLFSGQNKLSKLELRFSEENQS